MAGLFGSYDPALLMQQRAQLVSQEAAQAGQGGGAYAPLLSAGYRMGDILGGQVGKMFGMEDPVLKKATLAQEAQLEVQNSGIDLNNPSKVYAAMISSLQKRGLTDLAMPLIKEYQTMKGTERKDLRETVDFYTKNPTQATAALQDLAARIEANPADENARKQYESIAQAMIAGTKEEALKIEDKELGMEVKKLDMKVALKRLATEKADSQAARDFFTVNGLDYTKPLEPQLSGAQKAFGLSSFITAQKKALEGTGLNATKNYVAKPLPAVLNAANLSVGEVYTTNKGDARWDGEKFNPVGR